MDRQAVSNLVREYYAAYESKDINSLEPLLSDDFRFSSPRDARIDKRTYFERCWPNSEHIRTFHIEKLFEQEREAFVLYDLELIDGKRFKNVEFFRIQDGKIGEVTVYFGSDTEEFVQGSSQAP